MVAHESSGLVTTNPAHMQSTIIHMYSLIRAAGEIKQVVLIQPL